MSFVSSVSASACHTGGLIGVNHGELALVYGRTFKRQTNLAESGHDIYDEEWGPTKEENPHDDPYCNGSLVLLQQRLLKPLATADKIDLLEKWGV